MADTRLASRCDLTFDHWSARRSAARAETATLTRNKNETESESESEGNILLKIALDSPLNVARAGGLPTVGPLPAVAACQHYFSINFSFFIKLTQKFVRSDLRTLSVRVWHVLLLGLELVTGPTALPFDSAQCSLICPHPPREVVHPPPFFLLHLLCRHSHPSLGRPCPCLSRSRSECLNKIKSVPACAATGSYRMNGSHCSAQHWLPTPTALPNTHRNLCLRLWEDRERV